MSCRIIALPSVWHEQEEAWIDTLFVIGIPVGRDHDSDCSDFLRNVLLSRRIGTQLESLVYAGMKPCIMILDISREVSAIILTGFSQRLLIVIVLIALSAALNFEFVCGLCDHTGLRPSDGLFS